MYRKFSPLYSSCRRTHATSLSFRISSSSRVVPGFVMVITLCPGLASEHGLVGPSVEGRRDVRDFPVLELVPLGDQNRPLGRGFRLQLEEDGSVISFGNNLLYIEAHHDL